jgi:Na+/phosphate symporter
LFLCSLLHLFLPFLYAFVSFSAHLSLSHTHEIAMSTLYFVINYTLALKSLTRSLFIYLVLAFLALSPSLHNLPYSPLFLSMYVYSTLSCLCQTPRLSLP